MSGCWFDGSTVIITGASSGIGLELSRLLIKRHGCFVIGVARGKERLMNTARELGERFLPFAADVTLPEHRKSLLEFLSERNIKADILINNAGVLPRFAAFGESRAAELRRVLEINFFSQVDMCAEFLPMIRLSERGAVINVASAAALATLPGTAAYSSSKAATLAFTEAMSLENRGKLYVAAVCPGTTRTEIFSSQEGERELIARIAMSPSRMAKKIVRGMLHRRTKMVIGADAHAMSIGNRFFGRIAARTFAFFIKHSNLALFDEVFGKEKR